MSANDVIREVPLWWVACFMLTGFGYLIRTVAWQVLAFGRALLLIVACTLFLGYPAPGADTLFIIMPLLVLSLTGFNQPSSERSRPASRPLLEVLFVPADHTSPIEEVFK